VSSISKMSLNVFVVCLCVILVTGVGAQEESKSGSKDEVNRGGPHSQQYHYSFYGHDPYGYGSQGVSFDPSTALFLALGAIIVLLALAAVIYPLLSKSGSGGWDSKSINEYNYAGTAEKILSGIEKVYKAYNKRH